MVIFSSVKSYYMKIQKQGETVFAKPKVWICGFKLFLFCTRIFIFDQHNLKIADLVVLRFESPASVNVCNSLAETHGCSLQNSVE